MKIIQLLLGALLFPQFLIAQSLGPEISVADDNTYGKTRARIVMAEGNRATLMWGKKTGNKVFVATVTDNVVTAPVLITPTGVQAFVTDWAGPDIASKGNDVFVTFHSQPEETGFVYVVKSTDGGLTFGDTVRAENIGMDQSRFPVIAVDPNGNPAVMFMRFSGNWVDPQYVVANSTDGGMNYGADAVASEIAPGEVCDCCPAALLSEGQRQVAMFRNNDNNLRDLWVTISDDNGADFALGGDMDPNNWMINSCPSTGPDGYINGDSLYTVWMSAGQGASRIYLSSVHLPTATRGQTIEVAPLQNASANQNYPRIAGDGQTLGVVYQESASGNIDCYMTISLDGGNSFMPPFLLHSATTGTQRNPDVSYRDGIFHTVFEDAGAGSLIYRQVGIPGLGFNEYAIDQNLYSVHERTVDVQFSSSEPHTISVFDALGKEIYTKSSLHGQAQITVAKGGVYFLQLRNDKNQWVKKIGIQ